MDIKRIRRLLTLLVPLALVLAACGGSDSQVPAEVGPNYLSEAPSLSDLSGCPAATAASDLATVFQVGTLCEVAGVPDGYLVVVPDGAFALSEQTSWPAMSAALGAADADETAQDISMGWAAYQLRRELGTAVQVGWNPDGTAWSFLLPTSGGEEDGVDVVTPYDARFELTFDEDGNATGARFVEMCLLPGDWPGSTATVDAPTCPATT